eukprot:m.59982 g.59982  ORF g.59982 m.59982 type:complete len:493 (+) comp6995_c0_seq2:3-1481(+)
MVLNRSRVSLRRLGLVVVLNRSRMSLARLGLLVVLDRSRMSLCRLGLFMVFGGLGLLMVASRVDLARRPNTSALGLLPKLQLKSLGSGNQGLVDVLAGLVPQPVANAGGTTAAGKLTQLLLGKLGHKGGPGGVAVEVGLVGHVLELILGDKAVLIGVHLGNNMLPHAAHFLHDGEVVDLVALHQVQLQGLVVEERLELLDVQIAVAVQIVQAEEDDGIELLVLEPVLLRPDLLQLLAAARMMALGMLQELGLVVVLLGKLLDDLGVLLLRNTLTELKLALHLLLDEGLVVGLVDVGHQLDALLDDVTDLLLVRIGVIPHLLVLVVELGLVGALRHVEVVLILTARGAALALDELALLFIQLRAEVLLLQTVRNVQQLLVAMREILLRCDERELLNDLLAEALVLKHGLRHLVQIALVFFIKLLLLLLCFSLSLGVRLEIRLFICEEDLLLIRTVAEGGMDRRRSRGRRSWRLLRYRGRYRSSHQADNQDGTK